MSKVELRLPVYNGPRCVTGAVIRGELLGGELGISVAEAERVITALQLSIELAKKLPNPHLKQGHTVR